MKHYKLAHNNEYTFIDISDNGEMNYTTCDNCGTVIRYVVHLKGADNINYFVGTECVKTLLNCRINNEFSMNEQIREFKKVAEAQGLIKTNNKLKIFASGDGAIIVGLTKSNKPKKVFIKRIYDPFQEVFYPFIDSFLGELKNRDVVNSFCWMDIFDYLRSLKTN